MLSDLLEGKEGICIRERKVNYIRFAEDMVIVANVIKELQNSQSCKKVGKSMG